MQNNPLISIQNLTVKFSEKTVFQNINLDIQKGDMLSLVGQNGAGKTTLIRVLLGQLKPVSGQIQTFPRPGSKRLKIGYVPQFRNVDENYPLSIKSFVGLNRLDHFFPFYTAKEHQALIAILKKTHLIQLQNSRLGEASGGEKQRAYLAQALIDQPDLLILDESTASLDTKAKNELMQLVVDLNNSEGLTVIFITHDDDLAKKYTKHYALLESGSLTTGVSKNLNPNILMEE